MKGWILSGLAGCAMILSLMQCGDDPAGLVYTSNIEKALMGDWDQYENGTLVMSSYLTVADTLIYAGFTELNIVNGSIYAKEGQIWQVNINTRNEDYHFDYTLSEDNSTLYLYPEKTPMVTVNLNEAIPGVVVLKKQ